MWNDIALILVLAGLLLAAFVVRGIIDAYHGRVRQRRTQEEAREAHRITHRKGM